MARSGQENIAQGLPWVIPPPELALKGAAKCGENRFQTLEQDRMRISSPFRAKRLFCLTQGKPWAKLSCPFGAVLRPYDLRSLAIDVEVKILLRDGLVSSVLQQIGKRIVQGILQIRISFAKPDRRRAAQNVGVVDFRAAEFVAVAL